MVWAHDEPVGDLDLVMTFDGAMPTGGSVSRTKRIFLCFPRWEDLVDFTVAAPRSGQLVPYPNRGIQEPTNGDPTSGLLSVQSVVADADDRLWILDTGGAPTPNDAIWRAQTGWWSLPGGRLTDQRFGIATTDDALISISTSPIWLRAGRRRTTGQVEDVRATGPA